MDIFIPFHVKDADVLPRTVESLRQFVLPTPKRIVCISAPLPAALRSVLDGLGLEWLDESEIIEGLPRSAMPTIIISENSIYDNIDRTGWYFQQFLKWGARRFTKEPYYAVADADTVFIAPTPFMEDGKSILHRSAQHHVPYFRTYERLMGFAAEGPSGERPSFIADHMVFDVAVVSELLSVIEKRHAGKSWHQAILNSIIRNELSSFSEFETYGNYLAKFHPDRYKSAPYLNLMLAKDRIESHEQNSIEARKGGYSSISYHSHNVEEIEWVLREIRHQIELPKAKVILDVGSGNGDVSAISRRHCPAARIFAFECDPLAAEICRRNLGARTDITILEKAVGDRTGTREFFIADGAKSGDGDGQLARGRKIHVEGIALGEWLETSGIPDVDILWFGLRGDILHALRGLGGRIRKVKVIVAPTAPAIEADASSPLHMLGTVLASHGFLAHQPRSASAPRKHQIFVANPTDISRAEPARPGLQVVGRTAGGAPIISFGKSAK